MADYVLTENGGLHSGPAEQPYISVGRRREGCRLATPARAGHARPRVDAVQGRQRVDDGGGGDPAHRRVPPLRHASTSCGAARSRRSASTRRRSATCSTRAASTTFLESLPRPGLGALLHACTHTTFSCNTIGGGGPSRMKTNVIPDCVEIGVDVRTLPGERHDDVAAHLRAALGDLYDRVEVEVIMDDPASISRIDKPLWDQPRAGDRQAVSDRPTDAAVGGRVHRRTHLSQHGRRRLWRRAVQPRGRSGRLRPSIPRQRRARSTSSRFD